MLVSIIILTFNNWKMTERCLNSVVQYTHLPYELICIDNGSTDGTQGRLRNRTDILLIENSTNRGFAGACNQGISAARGDMMLLLNNDTVVSHRWLQNLVLTLHSSSDIGIVGPVSNMVMPMQRVPMSYATYEEYHPFAEIFNRHNPYLWRETTAVSGFCMLFPRCLIDKIGMLDEGFATGGYEDIDFGYRALKAGFRLIVAGDTHVHHEGNASFRSNSIDMAEQARKNRRSFIRKWGFNPERLIYTVDELFLPGRYGNSHCHHEPVGNPLPGGILVSDSKGNIYKIERGFKRPVVSTEAFQAFRFRPDQLVQLPDSIIATILEGMPLQHGGMFPEHYPSVFVARDAKNFMHLVSHGIRYSFQDFDSFLRLRFDVDETIRLLTGQLESLIEGPPIGPDVFAEHELLEYRLFLGPDNGLYYSEGGRLRPIPSQRELQAYGWQAEKAVPLPVQVFHRYPRGPAIIS